VIDAAAEIAADHCRWARSRGETAADVFAALGVVPDEPPGWDDAIMLVGALASSPRPGS
jgi:hypothetical protein